MIKLFTSRLEITVLTRKDAQVIADLVTEKVSRWTAPIPWPYKREDAEGFIDHSADEARLGIYLKGTLIGIVSMPLEDGDEAGFWIHEDYEGKGYATEAVSIVIDYAFKEKKLRYLDSRPHRDNVPSRRIHERLGFKYVEEAENYWPNKQSKVPVVLYRLIKEDWRQ